MPQRDMLLYHNVTSFPLTSIVLSFRLSKYKKVISIFFGFSFSLVLPRARLIWFLSINCVRFSLETSPTSSKTAEAIAAADLSDTIWWSHADAKQGNDSHICLFCGVSYSSDVFDVLGVGVSAEELLESIRFGRDLMTLVFFRFSSHRRNLTVVCTFKGSHCYLPCISLILQKQVLHDRDSVLQNSGRL